MDEDVVKKVEELIKKDVRTPQQIQDEDEYLDMMEQLITPINITLTQIKMVDKELATSSLGNVVFGLIMTHTDNIDEALSVVEKIRTVIVELDKKTNKE